MIKCVIFDIDNTLYSFKYSNAIALDLLKEYTRKNFGWSAEEFDAKHLAVQKEIQTRMGFNGICRDRLLRYQKMLEMSSLPLFPHAVRMYELYWNTMLNTLHEFPGVEETFIALKNKGLRIGVGTDMTIYIQLLKLERMRVLKYVDFLVTSEEVGEEKPSGKFFGKCIEKSGCNADECLFVGDDFRKDYAGAVSSGMSALLFNDTDTNEAVKISSLSEVLEHLR